MIQIHKPLVVPFELLLRYLHLERHPALADERREERVDGSRHGQAELVKDDGGLFFDLRLYPDRRGRYV